MTISSGPFRDLLADLELARSFGTCAIERSIVDGHKAATPSSIRMASVASTIAWRLWCENLSERRLDTRMTAI